MLVPSFSSGPVMIVAPGISGVTPPLMAVRKNERVPEVVGGRYALMVAFGPT